MLQAMNLVQILIYDMSVGHRDLDTSMAEKLFDINNISIIVKKICSERMAKRVRMNILIQTCLRGRILNNHLHDTGINLFATFLLF